VTWIDYVPALSAAVAAGTFVFSVYKQRQDAALKRGDVALQRELEAARRWTTFMDLAFENPEYAYRPDYCWSCKKQHRSKRPLIDIKHKNFISRFLFTAEEVLDISNDVEWKKTISSQMSCHEHYFLKEITKSQLGSYSPELKIVIAEWKKEKGKTVIAEPADA
jgi:hypothetical protein